MPWPRGFPTPLAVTSPGTGWAPTCWTSGSGRWTSWRCPRIPRTASSARWPATCVVSPTTQPKSCSWSSVSRVCSPASARSPAATAPPSAGRERPGMLGFRSTFNQPRQKAWWTDGSLDWFWKASERAGLPVGLLAGGNMAALAKIAERHPRLKLHIDHLGRSGGGSGVTDAAAFADLPDMLALAKYPNVGVKMSGAPSYSSQPYPYKNIHGYLRQIFEAFGPERSFWGTDITRMPCSYRQCVTMFTEELPWLKGRDLERVIV